jgi:putative ABC transport system permease protein
VDYWAFLGPALVWAGSALLMWRFLSLALDRGRGALAWVYRPAIGNMAPTVVATMARQRRLIARSCVLIGLAIAFALSTATFNATYRQQAEADAQLTNGADVTVTESPGTRVSTTAGQRLARVPGVHAVEPMQHRYAYVGADLQDLYGINPKTIGRATALQDPYFQHATPRQAMRQLSGRPDGILVSAETVNDFQLHLGDQLRLRLQDADTQRYASVLFHYVGIVNEFPTAPKDSFLVANASYVAAKTGSDTVGTFLISTGGTNASAVARRIQAVVGSSASVTDIAATRGQIGSSLTSVDLSGLTKLELTMAMALVVGAAGLVVGLGLTERRRSVAVAAAVGATSRQLAGFVLAEVSFVAMGGLLLGGLIGYALTQMLVKVLTGVFDPPPAHLAHPWTYLTLIAVATVAAAASAASVATIRSRSYLQQDLREL